MSRTALDAIFIVALPEEFAAFPRDMYPVNGPTPDRFRGIFAHRGIHLDVLSVLVGEMGRDSARIKTTAVLADYDPKVVVSLGLGGRLSDDLALGDIAIASRVCYWLGGSSAAKDGKISLSPYWYEANGSTYATSYPHLHPHCFSEWQTDSSKRRPQNLPVSERPPRFLLGPILSADIMVAETSLREALLQVDRKALAVDMESSGVAQAIRELNDAIPKPPLLVVRGISDDANEHKTNLEQNTRGNVRAWAMVNALRLSVNLIAGQAQPFLRKKPSTRPPSTSAAAEVLELLLRPLHTIATVTEIVERGMLGDFSLEVIGSPCTGKTLLLRAISDVLRGRTAIVDADELCAMPNPDREVDNILTAAPKASECPILIVDHVDDQVHRNPTLTRLLNEFRKIGSIVIGRSDTTEQVGSPRITCRLSSVSASDQERYWSFVSKYCAMFKCNKTDQDYVQRAVRELNLPALSFAILDYIRRQVASGPIDSPFTSPDLFRGMVRSLLSDRGLAEQVDLVRRKASELAWQERMGHIVPVKDRSAASYLIHQSDELRDFLIAEHVVQSITAASAASDPPFEHVYPAQISRFCKDLSAKEPAIQTAIIEMIERATKQPLLEPHRWVFLVYMAGRTIDARLKTYASQALYKLLNRLSSGADLGRDALLLMRSTYISRISLGVRGASSDYIDKMMADSTWDDLNRGFHLEFYGDIPFQQTDSLMASDPLGGWANTMHRLAHKIAGTTTTNIVYDMFDVDVYTLASLAKHRHEIGALTSPEVRNWLRDVLGNAASLARHEQLRRHVEMLCGQLKHARFEDGRVFLQLAALKEIRRAGWVRRGVKDAESVADHQYGAWLLGFLYLAETVDAGSYDKERVLRMLLVHDLAEVIVGDTVTSAKNEKNREAESAAYRRLGALGQYKSVRSLQEAYKLWQEFAKGVSPDAQVARDLDIIEAFAQLLRYVQAGKLPAEEVGSWRSEVKEKLLSQAGQEVLDRIVAVERIDGLRSSSPDLHELFGATSDDRVGT